jgi:hypothetical protein
MCRVRISIIETEAYVGFTISRHLNDEVTKLVPAAWDSDDPIEIPNSNGQLLVCEGSKAYLERKDVKGLFLIPVKVNAKKDGTPIEKTFYICSK